jgi:hypothetical protein
MLTRLETALGSETLTQKMVLFSKPNPPKGGDETAEQTINFVVGYSGSANSQGQGYFILKMRLRVSKPNWQQR